MYFDSLQEFLPSGRVARAKEISSQTSFLHRNDEVIQQIEHTLVATGRTYLNNLDEFLPLGRIVRAQEISS